LRDGSFMTVPAAFVAALADAVYCSSSTLSTCLLPAAPLEFAFVVAAVLLDAAFASSVLLGKYLCVSTRHDRVLAGSNGVCF